MIQEFVERWEQRKHEVEAAFKAKFPDSYDEIVKQVVVTLRNDEQHFGVPDPERITVIDDGYYQGTRIFIVGERGYQPDKYWFVKVNYGSCSGCDTLQRIECDGEWDKPPTDGQLADLMSLALHIVQSIKVLVGDNDD